MKKLNPFNPFKQHVRRTIYITVNHDIEIKLLQSAVKDTGTVLTYSQMIEKMIDDYLEKLSGSD